MIFKENKRIIYIKENEKLIPIKQSRLELKI
jgi:hypothetical protein